MSTKSKLRAAALGGTADEVEAAFYEALHRGDVDALMACWADEDEVFCVHPGGPRLVGSGAIRAAFEQMFADGGAIHAQPARVRARQGGAGGAGEEGGSHGGQGEGECTAAR